MRIEEVASIFGAANNLYEGGAEKWEEDGGRIVMLPPPINEIYIFTPPDTHKELINVWKSIKGVIIISKIFEPPMEALTRLDEEFDKVGARCLRRYLPGGILAVHIEYDDMNSEHAQNIIEILKDIKEIPIILVTDKKMSVVKIENENNEFEVKTPSAMINNPPKTKDKRNTVISQDDILNLKITLETMDVDSFINSL